MAYPAEKRTEGPRGTLVISYPAPFVFVGKIAGHYSVDLLADYIAGMDAALQRGRSCFLFHSWGDMTGYDSECRKRMTEWAMRHRAETARHHVLVRSKLVAMGVATAALLVGGELIQSHTDRTAFELAMRDAVRKPAG